MALDIIPGCIKCHSYFWPTTKKDFQVINLDTNSGTDESTLWKNTKSAEHQSTLSYINVIDAWELFGNL